MIFIGIDPGQSGGIAAIGDEGRVLWTFKLSNTEADISSVLETERDNGEPIMAVIEKVHSMPKQGVASSFAFGMNFGFLRGVLTALKIRWEEVSPQRWQKDMACQTKGDKNVSKGAAQRLFPNEKITHAIADSLLIAEWLRRREIKTPEVR